MLNDHCHRVSTHLQPINIIIITRWEKTCICLNGSLIKRRLDCLITGFTLHLALEFSRHMTNILLRFLNQLRRQIRSTSSGISIFLSLSKRIKVCVCSLSEDRETLIKGSFIISFIFEAVTGGAIFSSISSEPQLKIYGPLCYFVLPDIFRTKVAISVISTIFRFFFFFPKFLQELSEFLFFSFASCLIILK